jgi:hypothetical protein
MTTRAMLLRHNINAAFEEIAEQRLTMGRGHVEHGAYTVTYTSSNHLR